MYEEDDLIPLSRLQHLFFCGWQCALIPIEQMWAENRLTAEERIMHVHVRSKLRVPNGLPYRQTTREKTK